MRGKPAVVVVGNGPVAHGLVEQLAEGGHLARLDVCVVGEERQPAYDRVRLTELLRGRSAEDLALPAVAGAAQHLGDAVAEIDRSRHTVTTAGGRVVGWDKLVFATGSRPIVPEIPGRDAPGCFVYRTIDDVEALRAFAGGARAGAVIGGGLLGLEAAEALARLGLEVHVVERASRLMPQQLDEPGADLLRRRIEALGVGVHTGKTTTEIVLANACPARLAFSDGGVLPADVVVFAVGIRPRDELARAVGLLVGKRGGVVIDERCVTSDPDILAVGECASFEGRSFGLIAPGLQMARVAAETLVGGSGTFPGGDTSAKLKLLGVDVASFGDAFAAQPGSRVVSYLDGTADVYKKLVVYADGGHLAGGMLVGDAADYPKLLAMMRSRAPLPPEPEALVLPARLAGARAPGAERLPDSAPACGCHNVAVGAIRQVIRAGGATTLSEVRACTKAGSGCGSCVPLLAEILASELDRAGAAVERRLCEHFAQTRQDLLLLVRLHRIRSFDELIARHGHGAGCEVCKPTVASILASVWHEHVLAPEHVALQDSNDRFLANLQRDGSYSVVPRIAGGEIPPERLAALADVAQRHGLYVKITGAQRVALFGARVEQLPLIWRELVAAGLESGQAYGKALRAVKSCVGSTWCRYGRQDSVGVAIRLEHRYKGLRAPHKLKLGVSGCARECAEAQSKDFGVIATERGWSLYVGGHGGARPRHADLFATDLDEETLTRHLDRLLMFYVRTADRLERTASWLDKLDGGVAYLRRVVIEDALGIGAELDAEIARLRRAYRCEWRAVLEDPAKLRRFRAFVNADAADPSITRRTVRAQPQPADPAPGRSA